MAAPTPLRIEGIAPAPLTPEPDEAEVAAMALLESSLSPSPSPVREGRKRTPRLARREKGKRAEASAAEGAKEHRHNKDERGGYSKDAKERYEAIAERMREVREAEERAAMRYLAWCEELLADNGQWTMDNGQLAEMEQGLYRHMDAVERVGGELKRRWQHCLAEAVVRGMENGELTVDNGGGGDD